MERSAPESRPFRIIALDLDGTLLNALGEISAEDAAALRRFAERGGIVVLASGRMTPTIRTRQRALGLDGPTITYNGALVRAPEAEGGEVLRRQPLPARYADELIEYARQQRLCLNYYLGEKLYAEDAPELRRFADLYSRRTEAVYHFLPDLRALAGSDPTKALIVTDRTVPGAPDARHRDELYAVWHGRWGDEITVERSEPEYLEFLHKEAHKGAALATVAERYGVDRSLVLAIGDSYNDITMLEWAGCGVAVANAAEEAKGIADWVSPRTHNQSAVADVIARLVDM